jgi:hypothetical protein
MRPPVSTCDFNTTGPLISPVIVAACSGVCATRDPVGNGMPCLPNSCFDSNS